MESVFFWFKLILTSLLKICSLCSQLSRSTNNQTRPGVTWHVCECSTVQLCTKGWSWHYGTKTSTMQQSIAQPVSKLTRSHRWVCKRSNLVFCILTRNFCYLICRCVHTYENFKAASTWTMSHTAWSFLNRNWNYFIQKLRSNFQNRYFCFVPPSVFICVIMSHTLKRI